MKPIQPDDLLRISIEQNLEADDTASDAGELANIFDHSFWMRVWKRLPEIFDGVTVIPEFNDGYYARASLFLEEAELLDERAKNNRQKLLGELSRSSTAELLNLYQLNQSKFLTPAELARVFNNTLLQKLLIKTIRGQVLKRLTDVDSKDFQIQDWLASVSLDNDVELFVNDRLPVSLAAEFLELSGRFEEAPFFINRSSPDVAFNGPKLIGRSVSEESLKLAIEAAQLRILLSNVSRVKGDKVLAQLEDSWFEEREINREDYKNYLLPEVGGRELDFSEIATAVLANEKAIDIKKIREYCELEKGDSKLAEFDIKITQKHASDQKAATVRKPSNFQNACRLKLIEFALSAPSKTEELDSGIRETVLQWINQLVEGQPSKNAENIGGEKPDDDDNNLKKAKKSNQKKAVFLLAELFDPQFYSYNNFSGTEEQKKQLIEQIYLRKPGASFTDQELMELVVARFVSATENHNTGAESTVRRIVHGEYGNLDGIEDVGEELFKITWCGKLLTLLTIFGTIMLFCFLFLNPNSTSLHGFYKKKLADAFIVKTEDDTVLPEGDVRLSELCNYQGGSTAPYHLINVAINMQGSDNPNLRDRNADFFVFSKNFVGGESTGYLATKEFESAASDVTAATAMAVSAGAASPNMGQYTISMLSFLLTMVNLRLGYWIPNPKNLAAASASKDLRKTKDFNDVFALELEEIVDRRKNAGCGVRVLCT